MSERDLGHTPAVQAKARELLRRAMDLQFHGQLPEAIALYRESISLHPTAEAHTFLGWTHSFQGELDKAIACCQEAIAVDPTFGNPYNDIGAYLIEQGKGQEAIAWLYKALLAPRYDCPFYPHVNLARVYEEQGLWPKAMFHYQEALRLKPDYEAAQTGLEKLRWRMN